MENTKEEKDYIKLSKQNINSFIIRKEYKKAFGLLIIVLERLNDVDKNEFIDYYSKHMDTFGISA
jgi:hypothetical protein